MRILVNPVPAGFENFKSGAPLLIKIRQSTQITADCSKTGSCNYELLIYAVFTKCYKIIQNTTKTIIIHNATHSFKYINELVPGKTPQELQIRRTLRVGHVVLIFRFQTGSVSSYSRGWEDGDLFPGVGLFSWWGNFGILKYFCGIFRNSSNI